ncbi:MAG: hypothetical protein WED10_11460 [Brumimicrobium sp.]
MTKLFFSSLFVLLSTTAVNSQEIIVLDTTTTSEMKKAILLLSGFADSKKNREIQKDYFQHKGYDLFIPEYRGDETLEQCVANLNNFYNSQGLEKYDQIHIFSYILGSWTINKFIEKHGKKNISSIIYDRSPIQERAPCIASNNILFILWFKGIRFILKDLAETDYPPIEKGDIQIGIIIESKASLLMRTFKKKTLKMGPILWDIKYLNQKNDDYYYTWLEHNQMYTRLDIIGEEIFYFIKNGRFSKDAKREPFDWDPFVSYKKEGLE